MDSAEQQWEHATVGPDGLARLDAIVGTFYTGSQSEMAQADTARTPYRALAEAWVLLEQAVVRPLSTPTILWCAAHASTVVRRRWRRLAEAERAACRETVVALVLRLGHAAVASPSPEATLQAEKVYGVLGQLLRAAWPDGWPGFVPELLGGALPPPVALKILGLLADEALPPRGAAATPRAERVRACLAAQASTILSACAEPLVQQNGGASGDELRALRSARCRRSRRGCRRRRCSTTASSLLCRRSSADPPPAGRRSRSTLRSAKSLSKPPSGPRSPPRSPPFTLRCRPTGCAAPPPCRAPAGATPTSSQPPRSRVQLGSRWRRPARSRRHAPH